MNTSINPEHPSKTLIDPHKENMFRWVNRLISFMMTLILVLGVHENALASTTLYNSIPTSNVFYISTTGSDTNPGTISAPFRTFAKAVSVLNAGDTLIVMAGAYGETLTLSKSGTAGAPITVTGNGAILNMLGVNQNGITVTGSYIHVSGFEVMGAKDFGILIRGRSITVENNNVHDNVTKNGIGECGVSTSWGSAVKVVAGGENTTIRNNVIHDNCGEGIAVTRGVRALVENNTVYDNFSVNIYVDNSPFVTVQNNTSYCTGTHLRNGNRAAGIALGEEAYTGWGAQLHDIFISDNTITDCRTGIAAYESSVGGTLTDVTIFNNYVPSGQVRSISLQTLANQSVLVANNVIFNSVYVYQPAGVTVANGVDIHSVNIYIGDNKQVNLVRPTNTLIQSYRNILDGPMKVTNNDSQPIFTSQRVTSGDSYNELMGMAANQFTTEYWFPYYDHGYPDVTGSNMRTWILIGNPSPNQIADVDVFIGGVLQGSYSIVPGGRITPRWIGMQGGPVRIVSNNGVNIFASERVFTSNKNAFNESLGYPANQFTTEYWFPWYDNINMTTAILAGNTSASQTATVDIYIGVDKMGTYEIPPNTTLSRQYSNLVDGPVRVVSTNGVNIVVSENTVSGPGNSFSDMMGYPFDQFTTEYWFPYYDHGYPDVPGSNTRMWILIGNPSATNTANVKVYIDGIQRGSYQVTPGDRVTPRWIGLQGGPVRVVSDKPIFTSERVFTFPNSVFNEMLGYPLNHMTTEYWFPWYDSLNMNNDVLVGKP